MNTRICNLSCRVATSYRDWLDAIHHPSNALLDKGYRAGWGV
jgi:hypothetical protein